MIKIVDLKEMNEYEKEIVSIDGQFKINNDFIYFLMIKHEKILGYLALKNIKDEFYIERIFIKKDVRCNSLGSKLLWKVLEYVSSKNSDIIKICNNRPYEKFFIKHGFENNGDCLQLSGLLCSKKRKEEGVFGTVVSIIINIFLSGFKIIFGYIFNSKSLIADGFHSLSDVVGSIIILFSVFYGSQPADEDHPYGHGRIESIAGNIVGTLLVVTAGQLIYGAISDFWSSKEMVIPNRLSLLVAFVSIIIKYMLYIYKYRMGIRLKNDAIIADAKEHKSDVISTIGVLVGLLLSIKINPIFDPIAGIIVAFLIGKEGVSIIMETSNKMMNKQDNELRKEIKKYALSYDEVYNVHDLFMSYSGEKIYLSMHIRVNPNMSVYDAHEEADRLALSIEKNYEEVENVTIHIEPYYEEF